MHVFLTILAIVAIVLVVVMVVLYFLGKKNAEEAGRIAGTDAGRIPDSNHSCH